jgi:hypothetical protein
MTDRKGSQYEAFRDWYGEEFDPDAFDQLEANITLLFFIRWSRERLLPWEED